jgi:branched-chain amino acid transport system permease protein
MSVAAGTLSFEDRLWWAAPVVAVAALVVLPWLVADYQRIFVAEIFIWGLFALSFALVYGFGGMLSFAQAVFFGMGCYGFNLGTFYFGFGTWGAVLSAMIVAALFALPVGFIATRARHHHFLIVTIIVSVLITSLLASGHWKWIAGPYVTRSLTFVPEVPLGGCWDRRRGVLAGRSLTVWSGAGRDT